MAATKKKIPTVEIISKEMIKPSLPTPSHLRSYQISSLDQMFNLSYVRVVFFYNRPLAGETNDVIVQVLKSSLSETLTHYYPLAGKFVPEDDLIDCDDSGAEFTTAVIVGGDDGVFLGAIENPDIDFLDKLVSKENDDRLKSEEEDVILAIRITRFPGGEIAVGVCICHKISDAATLCSFMKLWSAAAKILISGETSFKELTGPVFDAPRLWPSVPGFTRPSSSLKKEKIIMKKFVFNSSSLTRLKSELSKVEGVDIVPTRVTSMMALIWHAVMNSSSEPPTNHVLALPVNIRKKMSPPLPDNTLGNVIKSVAVANSVGGVTLGVVLGLIKEAIGKVDEEYAKKKGVPLHEPFSKVFSSLSKMNMTIMISWCWFPFYEVDLGLGRPVWMTCLRHAALSDILLIDGPDGGIDALIGLNVETMEKFEKNPNIISFCDHSIAYG
ncbi:tabersonine-19-hydroxy-O-acetyltransferase-like [Impatiens glandulifera]|uniref:tabersonine-19-hydroxy-O-acetyltransferase-like n=1 Tax=Impatiens glandulifera TaxID=253017 RepID=UPI001FB0D591|nr:tabersonine-19-hydroxy-O-acetyltransferase-like [Impatiens glandulifera]